jgi:hypothetical protein
VRHKSARYPGLHQPIVERSVWDKTQEVLLAHTVRADGKPSESMSSPLIGKSVDDHCDRLKPSYAVKGQHRYRYAEIVNLRLSGGGGGIRTHERLSSLPIFKFDRIMSAIVQTKQSRTVVNPPQSIFRADVRPLSGQSGGHPGCVDACPRAQREQTLGTTDQAGTKSRLEVQR